MANYAKTTVGKEGSCRTARKAGSDRSRDQLSTSCLQAQAFRSSTPIRRTKRFTAFLPERARPSLTAKQLTSLQEIGCESLHAAKRQFFAADDSGITYLCIQVKENSLEHFTATDAVMG